MKLDVYAFTNRGGRPDNEDSCESRVSDGSAMLLVADGLGGIEGGSMASQLTACGFASAWDNRNLTGGWEQWLKASFSGINGQLLSLQQETQKKMRSTAAVLCIEENSACWGHVGDSRIYRLTEGRIFPMTEDHSVTYKKYMAGEITRNEMNFDEDRSRLLRSLGNEDGCQPDISRLADGEKLHSGDGFLLCTDGFWEYLYEEEMLIDFMKTETAAQWGKFMLLRIMDRIMPGSDNLTFQAVRIREES